MGGRGRVMQDRYGVTIKGKHVPHNVAARDWYCSCGYKVVTLWFNDEPNWRSVCSNDWEHDPDEFVHTKSIPYVQHRVMTEEEKAKEVMAHLPKEFQVVKGEQNGD